MPMLGGNWTTNEEDTQGLMYPPPQPHPGLYGTKMVQPEWGLNQKKRSFS